jgi:hypothetical protein
VEISVAEVVSILKGIQRQPERIYEMIPTEVRENIGQYLSRLIKNGIVTNLLKNLDITERRR